MAPVDEENLSLTSQRLINLLNSCKHPLASAQDGPSKARSDSSELAHDAQTLAVVPQLIRAHAQPSLRARRGFAPNGWKIASHAPLTSLPTVEISRAGASVSEVLYRGFTE